MNHRRAGDETGRSLPDETFLSDQELAAATELRAYAARVAPEPSSSFADRVMADVERRPASLGAESGPRAAASRVAASAGARLRVAFAQASGGSRIPLRIRLQATVTLLLLALAVSAGAALAAQSAATVYNWVVEPPAPAISSPSQTAGPQIESASPSAIPDHPGATNHPGNTDHPNPSNHPGNTDHPNPSNHPGNTDHPNPSNHPGNTDHPNPSNHPGNTDHPNPSDHPGVKSTPTPT